MNSFNPETSNIIEQQDIHNATNEFLKRLGPDIDEPEKNKISEQLNNVFFDKIKEGLQLNTTLQLKNSIEGISNFRESKELLALYNIITTYYESLYHQENNKKTIDATLRKMSPSNFDNMKNLLKDKMFIEKQDNTITYYKEKAKQYLSTLKNKERNSFKSMLGKPDGIAWISAVQILLNETNDTGKIAVDGIFGTQTINKVKGFQENYNKTREKGTTALQFDGRPGKETITVLIDGKIGDTIFEDVGQIQNGAIAFDNGIEKKQDANGNFIEIDGQKYYEYKNNIKGLGYNSGINKNRIGYLYIGSFDNGKYNGQGTMTRADGGKFEGKWENGQRTGQGTMTRANKNEYIGDWVNGNMHGHGTMTRADGDKFEGEWENDQRTGKGTYTRANKDEYTGDFLNNLRTGQGTYTRANGDTFTGEWKDSKIIQGTFTLNGTEYKVIRENNLIKITEGTDEGKYIDLNHDRKIVTASVQLEGQWHIEGNGTIVFDNGIEKKQDANGNFIEIDGQKYYEHKDNFSGLGYKYGINNNHIGYLYIGSFDNGKYNGQGTMTRADGDKFEGKWENGQRTGQGTMTRADGERYTGDFLNDQRNGKGTYTRANKNEYTGDWVNGNMHGHGTKIRANGDKFEGEWENDMIINGIFTLGETTYNVIRENDLIKIIDGDNKDRYIDLNHDRKIVTASVQFKGQGHINGNGTFIFENITEKTDENNKKYIEINGNNYYEYTDNINGLGYKYGINSNHIGYLYVGSFNNGKYNGQGTMTRADGGKFEGKWENGQRTGQGTMTRADGGKFEGKWENGQRTGQGTMIRADGGKFEGEWENDQRTGQGTFTRANGNKIEGTRENNNLINEGTLTIKIRRKNIQLSVIKNKNGEGFIITTEGKYKGKQVRKGEIIK